MLNIVITPQGVRTTLSDEDGEVLYRTVEKMQGPGSMQRIEGEEVWDSEVFQDEDLEELGDAIDELSNGPFGVAMALRALEMF